MSAIDRTFPWDANVSYNPEKCGLELLATLSEPNLSYEFNDCHLWRDIESGRLFFASDSGCSCPTPFEGYRTLSSLTYIPDALVLAAEVKAWLDPLKTDWRDRRPAQSDVDAFVAAARFHRAEPPAA